MKKVLFYELDAENKDAAITDMYNYKVNDNWPTGAIWNSIEDIKQDLEQDYNPNEHFSFYLDEFDEVETKIA